MNTLNNILVLILTMVLQVLIFNHLHLWGGVVLVYLLALIKMPVDTKRIVQIVVGFVCGLLVDVFCNTLGLHALTCVTMMWMRQPILHLYINADDVKTGVLCGERLGINTYLRYAVTVIIFHCVFLYSVEAFTLFNFASLLLKIFFSILLTSIAAVVIEFVLLRDR